MGKAGKKATKKAAPIKPGGTVYQCKICKLEFKETLLELSLHHGTCLAKRELEAQKARSQRAQQIRGERPYYRSYSQ